MFQSDHSLAHVLAALVAGLAALVVLLLLGRRLECGRSGVPYSAIAVAALLVRIIGTGAVALLPDAATLRGTDEQAFLILAEPLGRGGADIATWIRAGRDESMSVMLGLPQLLLGGESGTTSLRVLAAGVASAGLLFAIAAVHDLADTRAARVTAVLLLIDPSHVFFSTVLHKEVPLLLAEGVFIFSAVQVWRRNGARWIGGILFAAGLAGVARPYAGAALLAIGWMVVVHVSFRDRRDRTARRLLLVFLVFGVVGLGVAEAETPRALARLQQLQNAQTTDTSNLRLEPIDFSTRAALARNVWVRVGDFLMRPYPWQLANRSQQAAVLGTLLVWAGGILVLIFCASRPRVMFPRAGPLWYVLAGTIAIYAVTTGNAGTGYRHRVHVGLLVYLLVGIAISALSVHDRTRAMPRYDGA